MAVSSSRSRRDVWSANECENSSSWPTRAAKPVLKVGSRHAGWQAARVDAWAAPLRSHRTVWRNATKAFALFEVGRRRNDVIRLENNLVGDPLGVPPEPWMCGRHSVVMRRWSRALVA